VRELRGTDDGRAIKKTRWVLQKNPWNLTPAERGKLSTVQTTNRPLYRAYLLKETLCDVLDRRQPHVARRQLGQWIGWALRSRLPPFQKLARTVWGHIDGIIAYIRTRFSNGLCEGMNGKVRVITKRAYGFRSASSLIAMIHLCCTGLLLTPIRHFPSVRLYPT
jgi:transposase